MSALFSDDFQENDYNYNMRILVVEDEHRIAQAIERGLTQESYGVDVVYEGMAGYELASVEDYDLIILDVMLPGMNGITITKKLRSEGRHAPILLLTAKNQVADRVIGLDSGADDYLAKPFAFEELLARVRALLRRPKTELTTVLRSGSVELDTVSKMVTKDGKNIPVTAREYSLLHYLMSKTGRKVSKEEIIAHVWDYDADVLPNSVEAYVKRLRRKLGDGIIVTIRGFGYSIGA